MLCFSLQKLESDLSEHQKLIRSVSEDVQRVVGDSDQEGGQGDTNRLQRLKQRLSDKQKQIQNTLEKDKPKVSNIFVIIQKRIHDLVSTLKIIHSFSVQFYINYYYFYY